ncbi:MAG: hypothetical protein R2788_17925 [Saprospiraceae bacterium]
MAGELLVGANVVEVFAQNFSNNNGDLVVCLPPNIPAAISEHSSISLSDAHCTCN